MEFDITLAESFNYKYASGVLKHIQDDYQLQFVYVGAGEAFIDNHKFNMNIGDIIFHIHTEKYRKK